MHLFRFFFVYMVSEFKTRATVQGNAGRRAGEQFLPATPNDFWRRNKMKKCSITRLMIGILVVLLFILSCAGCAGIGQKEPSGGAEAGLDQNPLPEFSGQLAVIRQGDLWLLTGGKAPQRITTDGRNCSPAWSPDGRWLLFFKYDPADQLKQKSSLWVARADDGGIYPLEDKKEGLSARWSPVSDTLAYLSAKDGDSGRETELKAAGMTATGPGDTVLLKGASEKIADFCWAPSGNLVAYSTVDQNPQSGLVPAIKTAGTDGGEVKTLYSFNPSSGPGGDGASMQQYAGTMRFSNEGNYLGFHKYPFSASLSSDGVIFSLIPGNGGDALDVGDMLHYPDWVTWSPYGDTVAFIAGNGREALSNKRLTIVSANRPEEKAVITPEGSVDRDPAWSPDGKYIAFSRAGSSPWKNEKKEWPQARIWLTSPDGSAARCVSDEDTTGYWDYHPFWQQGGEKLMWVRVQGEAASIRQADADGGSRGLVFQGLDIPLDYYGAYNWEEVMAWSPGAFHNPLPFPGEQAVKTWSVGDRDILIERAQNHDHSFYLDDSARGENRLIVNPLENAQYEGAGDGKITFLAVDGGDTGNVQFPYRLIYNLHSGDLSKEDVFFPPEKQVSFGKGTWKQVLAGYASDKSTVSFDFKPALGETLAGGNALPYTAASYNKDSHELTLTFHNVQLPAMSGNKKVITTPDSQYVRQITLEISSGHQFDAQDNPEEPVVSARLALKDSVLYNAAATYAGGTGYETITRCTVRFRENK
jgi:Tol biopolymer transport system component